MNILQTAEFFVFPFVKLYVWLTGGDDGIVLFTRHLYLVWVTLVSLVACLGLEDGWCAGSTRSWPRWCARPSSSSRPPILATTLSERVCLRSAWRSVCTPSWAVAASRWLAAAGVAQALAVLAYPTLVAALPVTARVPRVLHDGSSAAGAARLDDRRGDHPGGRGAAARELRCSQRAALRPLAVRRLARGQRRERAHQTLDSR